MDIEEYEKLTVEQMSEMIYYNAQRIKRFHKLNAGALRKNNMFVRLKTYIPVYGFSTDGYHKTAEDFIFRDLLIKVEYTEEQLLEAILKGIKPENQRYYRSGKNTGTDFDKVANCLASIQGSWTFRFAVLPCGYQRLRYMDTFKVFLFLKEIVMVKKIKTGVFKEVDYYFQKLNKTQILQELTL